MARIVDVQGLENLLSTESKGRIVLAGGCFDILHVGHVRFLSEAKRMGDRLVVLLESDTNIRELKGANRPIFNQEERAEMLSALASVDWIVLLPRMQSDCDYLDLVMKIRPDRIAVTEKDPHIEKKRGQAKEVGAELSVVPLTKIYSTSHLAKLLAVE